MRKSIFLALALVLTPGVVSAAGPAAVYSFSADPGNIPSIQRGARNFVNYCAGCHGLQFLRYNRIARDLGIPEEMVEEHLLFTSSSVNEHMLSAISDDAVVWFGLQPPDLSLTARSKGPSWIYSFLNTYYLDPESATGYDNLQLPGAAMPHVLEGLQGVMAKVESDNGKPEFEQVVAGAMTPAEYREFTGDLTNFLAYAAEPGKADRIARGWKVIFYLLILFGFAYMLKREYWKDVH